LSCPVQNLDANFQSLIGQSSTDEKKERHISKEARHISQNKNNAICIIAVNMTIEKRSKLKYTTFRNQ
jgi:hypothetical protein